MCVYVHYRHNVLIELVQMIYAIASPLYAKFVCHAFRNPKDYPQFHLDGANKLRPDISLFARRRGIFLWLKLLTMRHGRQDANLYHNACCLPGLPRILFWLPLRTGILLCDELLTCV